VTLNLDFKVTGLLGIINALDVLCAQLMCNPFAIGKFLYTCVWTDWQRKHYVLDLYVPSSVTKLVNPIF